ncbi:hypothetical protein N7452_008489 [Penicillium brevicompactum]|uniref:Uncharacterized protein n=1 Tax=Penicillium brevicompactum TaxID=5074 RepID=A0A9W9UAA2_PENBR|nr:hypothetical protein N7452_008489 [Penicillium brevicompactum]
MADGKPSVFMINSRTLPEPLDSEPACWVTVYFHEKMAETHWDEDLAQYVLMEIQSGRAEIGHKSRHGLSCKCISLPVTGVSLHRKAEVYKRAAYIAQGWHQRILAKQVQLDRQRIFFKSGVSVVAPPKILEEGALF